MKGVAVCFDGSCAYAALKTSTRNQLLKGNLWRLAGSFYARLLLPIHTQPVLITHSDITAVISLLAANLPCICSDQSPTAKQSQYSTPSTPAVFITFQPLRSLQSLIFMISHLDVFGVLFLSLTHKTSS